MTVTKETKERFVKMLKARQIIVIQCNKGSNRKTYDFKFIGANNSGKWDFNPMVEHFTRGHYSYRSGGDYTLAIRAIDAVSVICEVLDELKKENVECDFGNGYTQYENVRDLLTTFYI